LQCATYGEIGVQWITFCFGKLVAVEIKNDPSLREILFHENVKKVQTRWLSSFVDSRGFYISFSCAQR